MWPFKRKGEKNVKDVQHDAEAVIKDVQPIIAEARKHRNENHVYLLIREALR